MEPATRDLIAVPITAEAFAPYGHLIAPADDGAPAGLADRALDLAQGTPRFYIMQLAHRGTIFRRITRHGAVTQVLASATNRPWLLGVAPAADTENPALDAIAGFAIPGGVAVLLHCGTWHAGPYFQDPAMGFFNLELTDTNETDHHNCDLAAIYGTAFRLVGP